MKISIKFYLIKMQFIQPSYKENQKNILIIKMRINK